MRPYKIISIFSFLLIFTSLFSVSGIERNGRIIKIRNSGVCYMDPGITDEQASLIAKYDAINNLMNLAGGFLERNDSLFSHKMKRNEVVVYLANTLDIFIYREGRENMDGYPTWISHITTELNIDVLNRMFLEARIDNNTRYKLRSEKKRLDDMFEKIKSLGRTTRRLPDGFIEELTNRLTATEWANKAFFSKSEGERMDYYLIALDHDVKYEAAYLNLSDTMIKINRYSDLLNMLSNILNIDPLNFSALYAKRGEVYYLQKQYSAAINELEKAIAINREYADAYCVLGLVYAALNKNTEALARFRQAIEADQNFYKPYFLRAGLLRKEGKYDEAMRDYDNALRLNPMNSLSYFNRGLIFYLTSRFENAVEEYSKAIYLEELVWEYYYNRSITYRRLDMLKKATEDYRTYLLLTDADLNRSNYGDKVNDWLTNEKFFPVLKD